MSLGEVKSPNMTTDPRAGVRTRISPTSKNFKEKLIKQCMSRMKQERQRVFDVSRTRIDQQLENGHYNQIFRDILFDELKQGNFAEEHKGIEFTDDQLASFAESDELDEADELVHLLGKDNYDKLMIWIEHGLRTELDVLAADAFEESNEEEYLAEELLNCSQDEFVLCPQCKEDALRSTLASFECGCGFSLPSRGLSLQELRMLLRVVMDNHRVTCAADVTFQKHKGLLYAYCWECGFFEPANGEYSEPESNPIESNDTFM